MAAAEVRFNSLAVRQAAGSCATRQRTLTEGVQPIVDLVADVANVLHVAGEADKVDELRQAVKQLLVMKHEVELHTAALAEVHGAYEMSAESTNFKRQLPARTQELEAAQPQGYNPDTDEIYRGFEETATGGEGLEAVEEQIDDDIAIEGSANLLAPNEKCPITGRVLLELEDPVADSKGFVYERSGIVAFIRQSRAASVKCPTAGTSHYITIEELQPARRVIKAQQRARRHGGATQHTAGEGADVLDVE